MQGIANTLQSRPAQFTVVPGRIDRILRIKSVDLGGRRRMVSDAT